MQKYEKRLFETRYKRFENEKSWNDIFERVANTVADNNKYKKLYYELMSGGFFLPSSPQLWNFGTEVKNGSSCFTMGIGDTLEEIYRADWESCQVYKNSGGCGYNLSSIRPRGSIIHNSINNSVGIVSVLKKLEATTAYVTRGRDRGALMVQLDVSHPDLIEFIFCKTPSKLYHNGEYFWDIPLQNVNISVRISDDFMNAVRNKDKWEFIWKDDRQEFKLSTWEEVVNNLNNDPNLWKDSERQFFLKTKINPLLDRFKGDIYAWQVWDLICENAHAYADPGIFFIDNAERYNPHPSKGTLLANPCFTGDMTILSENGYVRFDKFADKKNIKLLNKDGELVSGKIWYSGRKEIIQLELSDGNKIKCTPDHIFMDIDGNEVMAKDLNGKALKPYWGYMSPIVNNISYLGEDDVYDFSLDDNKHWGVVEGVIVHNCSEYLGIEYSSCNLGALNVRRYFIDGKFDWKLYEEKIRLAVRYLNDVISYTEVGIKKIDKNTKVNVRPIGLGIMKLADLLILENLIYGSDEAAEYSRRLMAFTTAIAWDESFKLAEENSEKYPIPLYWDADRMIDIFNKYHYKIMPIDKDIAELYNNLIINTEKGLKATNTVVTSVQPSGSIAQIMGYIMKYRGESTGIEPIFSRETYRRDASGERTEKHELANMPAFVTAMEVPPEGHIKMQAAIGDFTSMSIAKCIKEGTLIQTDRGIVPIENMGKARGDDIFDDAYDYKVKDINGNWQKVTRHYSGGYRKLKKIRFNNGFTIECTPNHKFFNGNWIEAKDLKAGDYVYCRNVDNDNSVYVIMITDISDSEGNVYDIEVENTNSYLINNIISHNTINLPSDVTVEDVKKAYELAWEFGIKGTTVYRDGSKPIQVLHASDNANSENIEMTYRPDRLYGYTERIDTGNGKLYMTITKYLEEDDYNMVRKILQKRGKIQEIFLHYGKHGSDIAGYFDAIGRLMSTSIRKFNGSIKTLIKQLKGISFQPSWIKGELTLSPLDAIAKALEREINGNYDKNDKNNKKTLASNGKNNDICPVCGEQYIYAENCVQCACGSKCG